jgi:hypothetical protein
MISFFFIPSSFSYSLSQGGQSKSYFQFPTCMIYTIEPITTLGSLLCSPKQHYTTITCDMCAVVVAKPFTSQVSIISQFSRCMFKMLCFIVQELHKLNLNLSLWLARR